MPFTRSWSSRIFFRQAAPVAAIAMSLSVMGPARAQEGPAPSAPPSSPAPGGGGGATGPSTPATPSIPGGTTPGRPGTATPQYPTTDPRRDPSFQEMRRPIYLSGRVMMDDGVPPPDFVTMYLVCNGQPRPQGYTDSKGRFSISLGDNNAMTPDASVGSTNDPFGNNSGDRTMGGGMMGPGRGGMTERELMNCELRAELPGYRSDVISLAGRRVMDNPEVGTIILHRLANVEGFTFSMTTAMAPKDAKKAYEKGVDRLKKRKFAEAQTELEKAVSLYPKYAAAWYELGKAYGAQKQEDKAREAFVKSADADPKFVSPQVELLQLAVNERDWEKIEKQAGLVIKLNPYVSPQVWFFHSVASYNLKNLDAAEKSAREAAKLDTQHRNPKIHHLLGVILADKGEYSSALDQMRTYLASVPNAPDAANVKTMVAELERLTAAKAQPQ